MKISYNLNDFLRTKPSCGKFAVTMGVFDGLHRGHQKIIKTLMKKARNRRLSTVVITFEPHPSSILRPRKKAPLLISLKHRLRLLEGMGLDYALVLRFNRKLARMSADEFIQKILGRINVREIVVGSDFLFGKKRKGSLEELKMFSSLYRYKISAIAGLKCSGKIISSTRIRGLILGGRLKDASRLLTQPVTILGTVIKGHKRGRIIGFPTANINPHHEAIPPSGVYAVKIKFAKQLYNGILNIGIRPTFERTHAADREPTIEAHIFDFNKSIYGKDLEIVFVKKIRNERKFEDAASLRKQIESDEKRARRILR